MEIRQSNLLQTDRKKSHDGAKRFSERGEVNVVSRIMVLLLAVLPVGSGAWAVAQGQSNKGTGPQPDPVMQALAHGVDHIDATDAAPAPALDRRNSRYRIASEDVLDLQFQSTPEFNQTVAVEPDGYITLREIGDVKVEGDTLPELRRTVQSAYEKILANPVISVDLKDFQRPYFMVLGQVGRPGKYDLRGVTTVSEAVALAGGFTPQSKHSQVLLFRRVNDKWTSVTKIDLKHMLNSRNLSEDSSLRPGDMVYVPQNALSKIKAWVPTPTMGTYQTIP
jgi:polysaccharide export outer membrane protein